MAIFNKEYYTWSYLNKEYCTWPYFNKEYRTWPYFSQEYYTWTYFNILNPTELQRVQNLNKGYTTEPYRNDNRITGNDAVVQNFKDNLLIVMKTELIGKKTYKTTEKGKTGEKGNITQCSFFPDFFHPLFSILFPFFSSPQQMNLKT